MLMHFLKFELHFWLRSWMTWIFLGIIGLMVGGALSSDKIIVGAALENTYRNAPFVIQQYYAVFCLLTLLMTTAFVNSAASRDFTYNTHQILFSMPLRKGDYLGGRFLGSTLIAVLPMLGITLAALIVQYMPWIDAERWGPVNWGAHLEGIFVFALPNTFFVAAVIFAIAAITRSALTSFVGALILLVGYGVSASLLSNLDNEKLAILLDPFGIRAFAIGTKYWTVADKNTQVLGLGGMLLVNRLLWVGIGCAIFALAYRYFNFAERVAKPKKVKRAKAETAPPSWTQVRPQFATGFGAETAQFLGSVRLEFLGLVKTTTFIVILVAALLNMIPSLALSASEGYGNSSLPVTYWILDIISGTLYLFLIALIVYFAGVLVWRERDAHMDEIQDALPHSNWTAYASKFVALIGAIVIIQFVAMLTGIAVQAWHGYTRYQIGLYTTELFLMDGTVFLFWTVLAFFVHVLSPNKYVGYFGFIVVLIANEFIWRPLNVSTKLLQLGSRPDTTYSDLFGHAPYWKSWGWFTAYWLAFYLLMGVASVLLWQRGRETRWPERLKAARERFHGPALAIGLVFAISLTGIGGWIFYNTKVLNRIEGPDDANRQAADYEKAYKKLEKTPEPKILSVKYRIDLSPESRGLVMSGDQVIQNKSSQALDKLYLTVNDAFTNEIAIDGARLEADDKRLNFQTYALSPPMQPGESRHMRYIVRYSLKGFSNTVSNLQIVQNGTFFNNTIAPQIGYQAGRELNERNDRKKHGLKEKDLMPPLERNCGEDCQSNYLGRSSDWVMVETVMSTSPDQVAIAPGSLEKEWSEGGPRYFQYKLDHSSLNFYSFLSARYEVARDDWNGVKVEVYYHKDHAANVPKMVSSIKKTLDYCSKNFGPYEHKEARIIEFPRIARFAQAFPGTMPYSESIGFIANLNNPDDIDMVYYVVAHEMGHQWWAHQVIGAGVQGATSLSETMAQYTALMVMEKEYGRDMMRKFLKYEMDNYLKSRGTELLKERPLLRVEANQGYVHYRKGSVVMYYLKEMIGEEAINRALHKIIQEYAYQGPPYPTAYALYDALVQETPAQYRYLLKDLFEDITLFSNRTMLATAKKRSDGKYDVSIDVEAHKFKADEKGNEREVPVDDWIEVGAFAKPAKGRKYGKTLYRERVHMQAAKSTRTFVVDELPEQAGIDPFALLVDRTPSDNLKKVAVAN